jgi:hypothetical protein
MKEAGAIVLAIFTVWPLLYCVTMLLIEKLLNAMISGDAPFSLTASSFTIFCFHILTLLDALILMVFYIVHLLRTDKIKTRVKLLWAAALLIGNIIVMPIFWYIYIWEELLSQKIEELKE